MKTFDERKNEKGFTLVEFLLVLFAATVIIVGVAYNFNKAMNSNKVIEIQQNILTMRSQIQQLYDSSADFTGLNNELVIKAGVAPKSIVKGGRLVNSWGGEINFSDNGSSFFIELTKIPQDECTRIASFQSDSWLSVAINSSKLDSADVASITNACSNTNTISFESM